MARAIPTFKILAVSAVIRPLAETCALFKVTSSKSRRYFWWSVINATSVIAGFAIGIHRGAIGVAIGLSIANYVALVPAIAYGFHGTPLTAGDFFRSIRLAFLAASLTAVSLLISLHYIPWLKTMFAIPETIILLVAIYLGLRLILPGRKSTFIKYISYVLSIFKARKVEL